VNMFEAIASVYRNYAKIDGRASAAEYWWFVLAEALVAATLFWAGNTFGDANAPGNTAGTRILLAVIVVGFAIAAATLVPHIAVIVRRLHDSNESGLWFWLLLLPAIGTVAITMMTLQRGTRGPNRYGPDPRDTKDSEYLQWAPPQAGA